MKDFTFITGNQHKADHLAKWLGRPITHHKVDLDEIQSLDPHEVAEHKVRQAYEVLRVPTLIEDTSLTFEAMGRLPGTYIKAFLEEIGTSGLCALANALEHRRAFARVLYALYDGHQVHYFENVVKGTVAPEPKGTQGFGWDPIFIPDGTDKTYGEMENIEELRPLSVRARAVEKLRAFIESQAA
ncbi:MAG TPA: non-canonical purine NTP pyrophosphatase [Candidatus Saccharimonadales bacterium]|nr:non-canonical purine NTP pyrophosphatase [Candidatus Saccharimonadales bacterium]